MSFYRRLWAHRTMPPPTGFKRSRALWDNARRPHDNRKDSWTSLCRAILYELQPIRLSEIRTHFDDAALLTGMNSKALALVTGTRLFCLTTMPCLAKNLFSMISNDMTVKHWTMVTAVLFYYLLVRWIHHVLEAGPVVLIVTALVAIFTFGLSDEANDGHTLSAYSVFNRGFQRILGSVDAEALMAQHLGGGMVVGMLAPAVDNEDEPVRRPQRPEPRVMAPRQQQQQQQQEVEEDAPLGDRRGDEAPANQNRPRLTGKKARRRDLEQRREMRRQREAAIAMGFGGGGGQLGEHDIQAMQRLIAEDELIWAAGDFVDE
jgi:Uncharacterized conserved domain (SAYSvFN)